MPLRKRKVLQKMQHVCDLTDGAPHKITITSQKLPTSAVSVPANKMLFLRSNRIKKNVSPISVKRKHNTHFHGPDRCINLKPKPRLAPYEGPYKCFGLTPKEKMQIIGNCQARSTRYAQLKRLATDAIRNNKIFTVYGTCKAVRDALVERGWVQKLPTNRMNMKNIHNGRIPQNEIWNELETLLLSHFVEKYAPNFIWRTKEYQSQKESSIDMTKDYVPTVNKLEIDTAWTTKQGLCFTIKRNYWFYIEGIAEVYCPRTYNSCDPSEIESFMDDFKVTACTSLLKWVLSMVANGRPVFVASGTVSIKVILFAVNRCKEYLYRKHNKDIDKPASTISTSQWNTFMKNYSRIISKVDYFKVDKEQQLSLYLSYAKFILKEIHKYRPQLSCEGCHNIWIIKPAHCCRGRGIKLASRLEDVNDILNKTKAKYVLQKYIEEPLLVHETKFDIRQYYLITSTYPLIIWMYKDCYLKFSTQKYNLKNYHESIHLTNNAVQKKYRNCENRHNELPLSNMWDSDTFKSYLVKIGKEHVWDSVIYPGMKKAVRSIVLGCQDSLVPCKNRFELYGCDFLLDKQYKPWLIEINSCPDLHHTTPVTAKICPAVVKDIIKVVIDHAKDPRSPTGKFECIYRQPHTIPRYSGGDLIVRGYSLPLSYFYKGKYEFKEPMLDIKISNHLDIAAVMKMMKKLYDQKTGLVREESDELPEFPDSDNQGSKSTVAIASAKDLVGELTGMVERVVSDFKVSTSTESYPAETKDTIHSDIDTLYSSTNSTNGVKSQEITEPGSSFSGKNWVDLRPLENALLDLSPSTTKLNPLVHIEDTKPQTIINNNTGHVDATSQALFNLLGFLNRKEREERERDMRKFGK